MSIAKNYALLRITEKRRSNELYEIGNTRGLYVKGSPAWVQNVPGLTDWIDHIPRDLLDEGLYSI